VTLNQWMNKKKTPEHKDQLVNSEKKQQNEIKKQKPQEKLNDAKKIDIIKSKIRKFVEKPAGIMQETSSRTFNLQETSEKLTLAETLEQEFLAELERLKAWIASRTYLQADLDTAGTMILGLATIYQKIKGLDESEHSDFRAKVRDTSIKELYQKVPSDFLPDPTRRALIRLIQGKPDPKDSYQIRKLQQEAEKASKTNQIYQIILELIDRAKFKAKMAKKKVSEITQSTPDV